MKKVIALSVLMFFVASMSLLAAGEGKRTNIFAGVGSGGSDLEGLVMEIGVEKQFFGNFYGQFLVDYYFNPYDLPDGTDSYAYSLNLFGVYKIPASKKLSFFLKAGGHLTVLREQEAGWLDLDHNIDLGIAAGGGLEFHLSPKVNLFGGVTVKHSLDEDHTWYKCYTGVSFRVK